MIAGKVVGFEAPILRSILGMLCMHDDVEGELVTELLQLPDDKDIWESIEGAIAAVPDTDLGTRICTLMLRVEADEVTSWKARHRDNHPTPVIDCLATTCEVDLQAIKAEVQEAMRAEAVEKAQAGMPKGKKGRKGKATTPEQALAASVED